MSRWMEENPKKAFTYFRALFVIAGMILVSIAGIWLLTIFFPPPWRWIFIILWLGYVWIAEPFMYFIEGKR